MRFLVPALNVSREESAGAEGRRRKNSEMQENQGMWEARQVMKWQRVERGEIYWVRNFHSNR